jgi:hypothetical protein
LFRHRSHVAGSPRPRAPRRDRSAARADTIWNRKKLPARGPGRRETAGTESVPFRARRDFSTVLKRFM